MTGRLRTKPQPARIRPLWELFDGPADTRVITGSSKPPARLPIVFDNEPGEYRLVRRATPTAYLWHPEPPAPATPPLRVVPTIPAVPRR